MAAVTLRNAVLVTPVTLALVYFAAGIGLFLLGPIDWPVPDWSLTTAYLLAALALIAGGFAAGIMTPPVAAPMPWARYAVLAGAIGSILLLFPSAYVYTHSAPWDFFSLLGDQRLAYEKMQQTLREPEPLRFVVATARMLLGPVTFVLPALAILTWGSLGSRLKVLAAIGIFAACSFSIFRGTDKEIFDLLILQAAAVAVVLCRRVVTSGFPSLQRLVMFGLVAALTAFFAAGSFVERKAQRLGFDAADVVEEQAEAAAAVEGGAGGTAEVPPASAKAAPVPPASPKAAPNLFCMSGDVCAKASSQAGVASEAEVGRQFALSMATAYATQGYYGLSLALEKPTLSMYGFGHSNILTRVYVALTGDVDFPDRALTYRIGEEGWDQRYQWASAYTWLANDFGVYGAALVIGLIALIWASAWKDAVLAGNQAGGVVFCLLALFFVYLPAGNQIMQIGDGYAALIAWVLIWLAYKLFIGVGVPVRPR